MDARVHDTCFSIIFVSNATETLHSGLSCHKIFGLYLEKIHKWQGEKSCQDNQERDEDDVQVVNVRTESEYLVTVIFHIASKDQNKNDDTLSKCDQDEQGLEKDVAIKEVVIAQSNAIVNPGAVMVKSLNTASADRAVTTATCSNCLTVGTKLSTLNVVKHAHKIYFIVGQIARAQAGRNCKEE